MSEGHISRLARPCGTWRSPVTPALVARAALRLGAVAVDGDDVYWLEGRPLDGGRNVIVKRSPDGAIADVTPAATNVRTLVHEYGGGAYAVSAGIIYYVEFADQVVYRLTPGRPPQPLTVAGERCYADFAIDPRLPRLVCVREDHTTAEREAITTLVSLPLDGERSIGSVIASGHDFYSTPRFRADGAQLCWLAWRHPQMPWDGTELWLADVAPDGAIDRPRRIAGGRDESIFQPGWSPAGELFFVSDRSGWWNLYCCLNDRVEAVHPMQAEFGRPQWQLGTTTWAFAGERRLVVTYGRSGRWRIATINRATGTLDRVPCDVEPADSIAATPTHAVLVGGWPQAPDAVVRVDLGTGVVEKLRPASAVDLDERWLAAPEPIDFPTGDGSTAYAFYYAPRNPEFVPSDQERPPLIVISHGGPTAATYARLNLEIQYWTSRGFAVVDVNYGGSAGYGRPYRERLKGQWGVVDVDDCVNAARHLARGGHIDADRAVIRGRSAGGYTTLAALTFRPGAFAAGASYYGVADLERLARETHKFERHYLDGLVGPYPEARDLYHARSPINHVDRFASPLILFQGLEDRIVPPNQSERMAGVARAKGLSVVLLTFAGEQHGFRKAETIVRCLDAELAFYGQVFGFSEPASQ